MGSIATIANVTAAFNCRDQRITERAVKLSDNITTLSSQQYGPQ